MSLPEAYNLLGLAPQTPVEAHLRVSSRCSFGCAHCPYFFPTSETAVSREAISRILTRLEQHNILHALLVAPDCGAMSWLPDVISERTVRGMGFDLVTGGPMPVPDFWKGLARAGVSTVIFELFGSRESHDRATVSGSFDEICAAMSVAIGAGLRVAPALRLLAGFETEPVSLVESLPRDIAGLIVQYFIPFKAGQEQFALGESESFAWWRHACDSVGDLLLLNYSSCGRLPEPVGLKLCGAGRFKIAVDPDGTVRPCEHFAPGPASNLGSLLLDPLETLWEAPLLERIRQLVPGTYKGACGLCKESHLCSGCCAPGFNLFDDVAAGVPICVAPTGELFGMGRTSRDQ